MQKEQQTTAETRGQVTRAVRVVRFNEDEGRDVAVWVQDVSGEERNEAIEIGEISRCRLLLVVFNVNEGRGAACSFSEVATVISWKLARGIAEVRRRVDEVRGDEQQPDAVERKFAKVVRAGVVVWPRR